MKADTQAVSVCMRACVSLHIKMYIFVITLEYRFLSERNVYLLVLYRFFLKRYACMKKISLFLSREMSL